ncbi:MAG: sigma-54-dependent Fis family transcriptional regulator [Mangrovibacterium sp.]
MDAYDGTTHLILEDDELAALVEERRDLVNMATPLMEKIYKFVAGSGFLVMLTDERGYILEVRGDQQTLNDAQQLKFIKGAAWTEKQVGTNAIGTAIYEKCPLQVSASEHYCFKHHHWTCSAAPIFDEHGEMIGILDMSGPSGKTHQHTLGIVVSAVEAIMFQMRMQQKNREMTIVSDRIRNVFMTMSDGVIVLNKKGNIVQVNPVVAKLLGNSPQHFENLSIYNILPHSSRTRVMLDTGHDYNDVEIIMQGTNGLIPCVASGKPIHDERGMIEGGMIVFNPLNKISKLVNRFSGAQASFQFEDIVGKSRHLQEAVQIGCLAAGKNSNVLLQGESGTGKELFAQAIHNRSLRRKGPFVALNCGAIPRELLGSELFGYVEGAFTGARRGGRPGKFELASGGTLFLDEIGEMPLDSQVALLRAIQERVICRIGDDKYIPVDVRIICATNRNLRLEVEKGNFRQDLYYRLNVISIVLPPLRERREDIPVLFNYFLEQISRKLQMPVPPVNLQVMGYLIQYDWPGNVRELQNIVERMINISNGKELTWELLPQEIIGPPDIQPEICSLEGKTDTSASLEREKKKKVFADLEKKEIINLLSKHGGNISRVALDMGVSRNTIYRKMKRYHIGI